ncbi:hypothetical protein AB0M02_38405 [Actinoplanes sp. NPDC051861]|uniref:hypothetical protein n=1 Tax=Actinoplanes sp. NPDC051861 TaxID=3155170 RepID=UPI003447CA7B
MYRISTGDDMDEALAMARRLLALRSVGCCPQDVSANVWTRAAGGYLGVDGLLVSGTVMEELTEEVVAGLPEGPVELWTRDLPLDSGIVEQLVAVVGPDPATISWDVCWPGNHTRCGFEVGLNGAALWHPVSPAGHSVYVHVSPSHAEQAHELAAAVGGRVMGEPATGW